MAWSDFNRGEKFERVGFIMLAVAAIPLTLKQPDFLLFHDIFTQKIQIVEQTRSQLKEVCLQGGLPAPKRQECRRLENLLDVTRIDFRAGNLPLPRWNNVEDPDLRPIERKYSKSESEIRIAISRRETNYHLAGFTVVMFSVLLSGYGRRLRQRGKFAKAVEA